MRATLPLSAGPRLSLRQSGQFAWLMLRERYLARRMHRAVVRQGRVGVPVGGGRLLHFTRRWLACHAKISAMLGAAEPDGEAEARAILAG